MQASRTAAAATIVALTLGGCGLSFEPDTPRRSPAQAGHADREPSVLGARRARPGAQVPRIEPGTCDGAADVRARGVNPQRVRLVAMSVQSGPGSSAYRQAPEGAQAAVRRANDAGGICDRLLDLSMRDTGWDATRGYAFLGVASLEAYLAAFMLDDRADPTVLSGMPTFSFAESASQEDAGDWIWPVGVALATQGELMVRDAYDEGARSFAVVYDRDDRRSSELARAARAAAGARDDVTAYEYVWNERDRLYPPEDRCPRMCDVTIMTMDAGRALAWLGRSDLRPRIFTSVPHWLIDASFAEECADACEGFVGLSPFALPADRTAATRRYARAVSPGEPSAAPADAYTVGAYVMGRVLVEAMREVGAALSRRALREALDGRAFDTGLTGEPLRWGPDRRANRSMRPYRFVYGAGGFAGFEPAGDWLTEPR